MANNIKQALDEAIQEALSDEKVVAAEYIPKPKEEEQVSCGYVRKLLNVMHKVDNGGHTFSHKLVYINTNNFTYKWHYGGPQINTESEFKKMLKARLETIKTEQGFDFIEIKEISEENESAILSAIQSTTSKSANIHLIKIWRKSSFALNYKLIN